MYLPRWPLQHLCHSRPELRDKPVAIIQRGSGGAHLTSCCARAARAGVRAGMPLAEALAICRQLFLWEADPANDRLALESLAEWAQRFSPIVSLDADSLLLDISGCASCFHGEDNLAQQAARELRGQGWKARIALAGTLGAAWAVAHAERVEGGGWRVAGGEGRVAFSPATHHRPPATPPVMVPSTDTEQMLALLPIAALRLPAEAVQKLAAVGIERIEQLAALPRASVPGRFGVRVLERLDQALGRLPELLVPYQSPPEVQAGCDFEYATDRRAVIDHALEGLLERIETTLRARNRGARNLECCFYHETSAPLRLTMELFRPSRSAQHLGKLLRTRLEQVQLAEPVRRLQLRVPAVELLPERQLELFEAGTSRLEEVGDLIDRLASQFGRETVTFARLIDDCQPEYACRFDPAMDSGRQKQPPPVAGAALPGRPLQLWPVPMPIHVLATFPAGVPFKFLWSSKEYTVRQRWGPERIATGWWRGCDVQRDYYIVETHTGTRLWLFREQGNRWFLHGCFD